MDNNVILTDMDESIGFYKDLYKMFEEVINDALKDGDVDTAKEQMEYLEELNEHKHYTGLLLLSMNNGMGFTCQRLVDSEAIKQWKEELCD